MTDPRFAQLLKERIGLDAESVGDAVIERAVRQRCNKVSGGNAEHYWMQLQGSAEEVQALIEAVIVPETWFFRYPESFGALADLASRRVLELAGTRPLRILSLPCSTGEEPYSIIMALLDAGLAPAAFQVDALDVSRAVLERAEEGRYGRNSFRGSNLAFRDRYFSADGNDYQLAEAVRRKVRFRVGNLLAPGLLAGEAPYDYVFCRNLLIYFDRPTQEQVVDVLRRLARPDGVLFIGPAEASLMSRIGLRPLGVPQSFAFPLQDAEPAPRAAPLNWTAPPPIPRPAPPKPAPVRPRPASQPGQPPAAAAGNALEEIARLANSGQAAEARQRCEALLAEKGPNAEAFYWLGLLADAQGLGSEAQAYYRKALYLQPDHQESLQHLAALLAAQGDAAGARRLQERAARGVKRNG
ncbi:CheR family methyltransferase [Pseudomonas sp. BGr12]|uniref:CheR family methyltransferase n=1 Tax=unclassified Pseudomonas TaxID=196821 RepID=UPI00177D7A59|nr:MULTISPECIES: CheR family methyltransferase [unclassified Pseudomonas]MBD9503630.1 chemotaxis protein CheR [Pseudomonas sp. PDM17]MBD9574113.1 chemotaxis protein CheR [Pseudomonas sp. PDM23]MBD9671951.1 chemotaxis protein CheR [Pseudomonas sp. PDM21]MDL2425573.1 chemotaxis protein CheR [Pseudomonas sp. BJa5]